jgi:hypothetical protein
VAGRGDVVTDVRRVTLLAAVLWIGLHLTEALVYAHEHRNPPVLALGILLAALVAFASLGPLFSSEPAELTRGRGFLLVLGATATMLCVHPFLTPAGLITYANWPMGEVGVLIATLVLRECLWGAVLATAVSITSNAVAVWGVHQGDASVGWVQGLFLSVPPLTWLLASLGIRAVLRRGARLREEYSRRSFTFTDEERLRAEVRAGDEARRRELRTRIEPLLGRVAQEGATPELRAQARLAAQDLRDTLKARSLLTAELRDHIATARARGVRVTVSTAGTDTAARPSLVIHARELLELALARAETGATLSCRVVHDPPSALLLVRSATTERTDQVRELLQTSLRTLRRADPALDAVLEEHDGELLLELRERPA